MALQCPQEEAMKSILNLNKLKKNLTVVSRSFSSILHPIMLEFELRDPPKDGVSSLNFSQFSNNLLLSTSWDKVSCIVVVVVVVWFSQLPLFTLEKQGV